MVIWAPLDPLEFDTHHELEDENIVKSTGVIEMIPISSKENTQI